MWNRLRFLLAYICVCFVYMLVHMCVDTYVCIWEPQFDSLPQSLFILYIERGSPPWTQSWTTQLVYPSNSCWETCLHLLCDRCWGSELWTSCLYGTLYPVSHLSTSPNLNVHRYVCILCTWKFMYFPRGTSSCTSRPPAPQVPVLVWLSAAVINTVAKSIVWRKGFIWLTHHWSPSLREAQNCKGKFSSRWLSHIV